MTRTVQISLVFLIVILSLAFPSSSAAAQSEQINWCGNGSEPDYGFSYEMSQPHWTVGNGLVSEQAMVEVDTILDRLNADKLAQTMILVLPADQVGIPVNCAVHFLRYMGLGLVDGPHKDNGFAFLFIVGQDNLEVHYGVGLGLPALTAHGLTDLNRLAESTYDTTGSLDTALIDTVKAYDVYVREKYSVTEEVKVEVVAPPAEVNQEQDDLGDILVAAVLILVVLLIAIWVLAAFYDGTLGGSGDTPTDYQGGGGTYSPPTFTSSRNNDNSPSFSSDRSEPRSNPSSKPTSRGGSGSGRAGRGN